MGQGQLDTHSSDMKRLSLVIALLLSGPATAQVTLYNQHPMTWQTPSGCKSLVRFGNGPWTPGACSRVEVSTAELSHNIRFVTEANSVTYITSKEAPAVVHAMGFIGTGETVATPAQGKCTITPERFVSCSALAGDSIAITHVAAFVGSFPELQAILR